MESVIDSTGRCMPIAKWPTTPTCCWCRWQPVAGMRQLNGLYTERVNRRHYLVGHLFQGRCKVILVQKDTYLLELARYVVLNLLRARMVDTLDDWRWSSHRGVIGMDAVPRWLDTDWLLGQFAAGGTSRRRDTGNPSPAAR